MAGYGFVSGLPLPLSGFTFRLWLADSGADLSVIGLTTSIGLAYSLKFLWAPLLDQSPPFLSRFGRRRGWLMLIQPLLGLAAVSLAFSRPSAAPVAAFAAATCVAVLSATQDIAIDAWRIETFPERRQGLALAVYVWGYRVALLVSSSGAIAASGLVGWPAALLTVALLAAAGVLVTLCAGDPGSTAASGSGLKHVLIDPVRAFFVHPRAWLILAFVALFKLGEALAGLMTAPFYKHLGFANRAIAGTGLFSLGGTLAGITLGGALVARFGVGRTLLVTGSAQTLAMAMYVLLSLTPGDTSVLYATVTTEAFAQGVADAAFLTFLSALCARMFAATQYALLSSVPALAIHTIGNFSGRLVEALGWTRFYLACMAAAVPGMLLMVVLLRHERGDGAGVRTRPPGKPGGDPARDRPG
jgi:PAT family beta-lactamase induction signal transducer AmpG